MPLRVTACDIGLGPRRLLLLRAYVRTSDPVRSLPRVVCVLAQSAKKTRLRVSAVSPTLGARPRASDPRDLYRIVTFCNVSKHRPETTLARCYREQRGHLLRGHTGRRSPVRPAREPTVSRRPASRWWSSPAEVTFPLGVFHGCLSASASIARERSPPRLACVLSLRMRS